MLNALAIEILKASRQKISDKTRWTQKAYARLADGKSCGTLTPNAVCWCALGALSVSQWTVSDSEARAWELAVNTLNDITHELYDYDIVDTNDQLGHEAILKAFDVAIAKLEGKESDVDK